MEAAANLSNAELLAKLRSLTCHRNDPPDGYLTNEEWASKLNVSDRMMLRYLKAGLTAGIFDSRKYTPRCGGRVIPHYKLLVDAAVGLPPKDA